jgi:hypothetical protein
MKTEIVLNVTGKQLDALLSQIEALFVTELEQRPLLRGEALADAAERRAVECIKSNVPRPAADLVRLAAVYRQLVRHWNVPGVEAGQTVREEWQMAAVGRAVDRVMPGDVQALAQERREQLEAVRALVRTANDEGRQLTALEAVEMDARMAEAERLEARIFELGQSLGS